MDKITVKTDVRRTTKSRKTHKKPLKIWKILKGIIIYYNEITNALLRSNKRDERESNASHLM